MRLIEKQERVCIIVYCICRKVTIVRLRPLPAHFFSIRIHDNSSPVCAFTDVC